MVKQLIQRPFSIAPAAVGANAQTSISPDGKWVLVCNETTTPVLYRWTGVDYVVDGSIPNTAAKIVYSGSWSPDGAFLLLQTGSTLQLRSFDGTTGFATLLNDTVAARSGATVRHFYGDHYIAIKTRASTGVIAEWYRHNRAGNTLTRVTSYTSGASSSIMAFAVIPNKRSIFIAWRNLNGNSVRVCYFNESTGAITFSTTIAIEAGDANVNNTPVDVAVSDDGAFWYRVCADSQTRCRTGTITSDGTNCAISPYDTATLGAPATQTGYMFGSKVIFRGAMDLGGIPYDRYNLNENGVINQNTTEVLPISGRTVGFSRFFPSGSKDNSLTPAKTWAFLAPSISVYDEVTSNDTLTLAAQAPVGDATATSLTNGTAVAFAEAPKANAFSFLQTQTPVNLRAEAPIGDAWFTSFEPQVIKTFAESPMGDARLTTIGQHFINVAVAPMADAWAGIPNDNTSFIAVAPMADAWLVTSFETADMFALAPMGDGLITVAPAWVTLFAESPMADASFDIPNVYVNALFALAPMADASFDIPNVYVKQLFSLAPKGDATFSVAYGKIDSLVAVAPFAIAFFDIAAGDYRFNALSPMGEATVDIQVPITNEFVAAAPMADAGIALDDIVFICRRRGMMVIRVR